MIGRIRHALNWLAVGFGRRGHVLDVGSGNSPHPRADVLCDLHLEPVGHRRRTRLVADRPFVGADVCALPFANRSFSFAICRMILEHLEAERLPQALQELARVAPAGYLETPSAICELLMPDPYHRTFVEVRNGGLVFTPKLRAFPVPAVAAPLLHWRRRLSGWQRFLSRHEELFVVRFHWSGTIPYEIRSPGLWPESLAADEEDLAALWDAPDIHGSRGTAIRNLGKTTARLFFRLPVWR